MAIVAAHGAQPIPGYRLLEPLGQGGFGEVWKCEAPGGLLKAMKFIARDLGLAEDLIHLERQALQQLKSMRHPFLVSIERVEEVADSLVIVMELADENLRDVLRDYQEAGSAGLPRNEALAYLGEVAEVLDVMNLHHRLLHLDVKPDNIFLMGDHAKVGDFGLVTALAADGEPRRGVPPGLSPRYASPELCQGQPGQRSDQYSLAIVYHELRTGGMPFDGRTARQLLVQQCMREPDLSRLPAEERPAVARALAKGPVDRFACCQDFIEALRGAPVAPGSPGAAGLVRLPSRRESGVWRRPGKDSTVVPTCLTRPTIPPERWLAEQVARVGDCATGTPAAGPAGGAVPAVLLEKLISPASRGLIRRRLDDFFRFWDGRVLTQTEDTILCHVNLPASYTHRYVGCVPVLGVEVRLQQAPPPAELRTEIEVRVQPIDQAGGGGQRMLQEIGPLLLESLAGYVAATTDRRHGARVAWHRPVLVYPLCPTTGAPARRLSCQGKDLSLSGMRFLSPVAPGAVLLEIDLAPGGGGASALVRAEVVWTRQGPTGWQVGVRFLWDGTAARSIPG